jgi:uncharacterized delta-60 repeat protein
MLATTVPFASLAGADPAALDSSFDGDGVATITAKQFTLPVDRIAARPDGRLVVGSFSTPTNRLYLVGLDANGSLDTSFGGGVVDSGIGNPSSAVDSGALTTQVVNGSVRIVAAGAVKSGNGGKVTVAVTRFLTTGALDTSFGSGGTAAIDIGGGPDDHATSVVAQPDGKLVVGAWNSKGAVNFTVLRLSATGQLDPTFNSGRPVAVDIAGGNDYVRDVAVDGNGRNVAAGVARRNGQDDAAVVRINPDGSLDTTFGTGGKVAFDAGSGQADGARSLALDSGAIYAGGTVSPAQGTPTGFLAKLTSAGGLDATFGNAGYVRGITFGSAPGSAAGITSISVDGSHRVVAAGAGTPPGGPGAIGVARFISTGVPDVAFGQGTGRTTVGACDSGDIVAAGAAIATGERLVVSGACSTGRYLRVARLLGAAPIANVTYSLTPAAEAAGREQTPLSSLDPLTAFREKVPGSTTGTTGTDAQGTGLGSIGLGSIGLGSIGLGSIGLGSIGLGSIGLGSIGLGSIGLGSIGLGSIGLGNDAIPLLLSEIGLGSIDWPTLLADVPALKDVPLQSITLQQLYAQPNLPDSIKNLTLGDVSSIRNVGLGSISLQALLLSQPLQGLPAPLVGGQPATWCEFLNGQPYACPDVDPATTNLFALEARGDDLSAYYARPLTLLGPDTELTVGDRSAIVAAVPLAAIDLGRSRVGTAPASEFPSLLQCSSSCAATLAAAQDAGQLKSGLVLNDLVNALPTPGAPQFTLGDALAMMLPASLVPYESISLDGILDQASFRSTDLVAGALAFDVDCAQSAGLRATVVLPTGFRYVPGTSKVATAGGTPTPTGNPVASGGALRWDATTGFAAAACPTAATGVRRVQLAFSTEPSALLGPSSTSTAVVASDADQAGKQASTSSPVVVDDSRDSGDTLTSCPAVTADQLYTFHLARADDIDCFTVTAPPTPGAKLTVTASHLPADYDVVVLGPPTGPVPSSGRQENTGLGSIGLGSIGLGSIGLGSISVVPDSRDELGGDPTVVQPNPLQDIIDPATIPAGYVVRNYSAARGTANESASVIVESSDIGKSFIVRFSAFNGATFDPGAARYPAVARIVVADPPAPKPCITRNYTGGGVARPAVGTVASDRQTLFLVAPKRLGDIYGATAAAELIDGVGTSPQGITQLAARADVKGATLFVDSDPGVAQAYAAWDADPCSVSKANAVVTAINELVDAATANAPALRHVVIVGNDEVIPFARVHDGTIEANQREYTDQVRSSANDNPISRSFLEGNLLSDGPYGDFDPLAAPGGTFHDPDVAVGRLVETPAEIQGTVNQFFAANGVLNPTTAFVTGYDFLTDGANAVKQNLAKPDGSVASQINETWTSQQAVDGVNQPGTGYRSVNAHYSHWQGLPALAFHDGTTDRFSSASFTPPAGNVLFTMGCQSGLNVPDVYITGPSALDFAQAAQRAKSSYIGNTGFGYGDTEAVAYSEKLMATYAKNVASGTMTAGQALLFAKKAYVAGQPLFSAYDLKAIEESTFYGLPMYRIGSTGQVAAPALPAARGTSTEVRSQSVSVTTNLTRTNGYYVAGSETPLVVPERPIVAVKSVDVTSTDGVPVTGAILESGTIAESADADRTFACPTIDLSANEPCGPSHKALTFPAAFQSVTNTFVPGGRRDVLQVLPDQWSSDGGSTPVNRRLLSGTFTVYRTAAPGTPCTISAVDAVVVQGGLQIDVRTGGCTPDRAVALYQIDGTTLRHLELGVVEPGHVRGTAALPAGVTSARGIVIQVLKNGIVSTSVDKTTGYQAAPAPAGPGVSLSPPTPASGYYTAVPVTVTVDGSHGTPVTCTINGGAPFVASAPFEVSAEGTNTVVCTAPDGTSTTVVIAIDTTAPTITPVPSARPGPTGWYTSVPVTVTANCSDPQPGSGAPATGTTATFTADGANQSQTVSCTDAAGNTSSATYTVNIDTTPPDTTITGQSVVLVSGKVSGTAEDLTSLPAKVTVVFTPRFLGATKTAVADVSGCTTTTCGWSVPPPDVVGTYDVTAVTTDRAGNVDPTPATLGNLTVR